MEQTRSYWKSCNSLRVFVLVITITVIGIVTYWAAFATEEGARDEGARIV